MARIERPFESGLVACRVDNGLRYDRLDEVVLRHWNAGLKPCATF